MTKIAIEARWASENPSNDNLIIWHGHELLARIDQQDFLDLLGPKQQRAWLDTGKSRFNIQAEALRNAASVNYMRY